MLRLRSELEIDGDSMSLAVQLRSTATAADDLYALARRFGPKGTPIDLPVSSSPSLRRRLEDALLRAGYVRDRDTVGEEVETWWPDRKPAVSPKRPHSFQRA
ncbi:hypothetical protein [Limnoglobus roseus]|uniref:Uncharacterized protein n=1 Tax=Limnoglobus roseus TaxID=2598579 RepID=A0A5C1AIV9_9BACT|nr:hypothetical protein [Limnoglobus roseus]QEL16908.1 hypothetical protein PX52LOC_03883 [Limnoglobus roseus]